MAMSENEAKDFLQGKLDCMNKCDVFDCKGTDECDGCNYCYSQGNFGEQKKTLETAIKALEEIQQYRAIGLTPELIEAMQGHNVALINDLGEYQAIGTIDEFKALKEKSEPKKIDIWANGEEHCPFCDKNLTTFYGFANCFSCGQKLDWE